MADKKTRGQIVEAANQLIYQQGYEHTSFSDIANQVQISRGNFYYHFKSKDEILDAVITERLSNTQDFLQQWEADAKEPADAIRSFINMLVVNRSDIISYGCPVGTLCSELAKLNHGSQAEANKLFALFRAWLLKQFNQLGHKKDADELAMHLLMRSQGVAMLANTFCDEKFIRHEVKQMHEWLESVI